MADNDGFTPVTHKKRGSKEGNPSAGSGEAGGSRSSRGGQGRGHGRGRGAGGEPKFQQGAGQGWGRGRGEGGGPSSSQGMEKQGQEQGLNPPRDIPRGSSTPSTPRSWATVTASPTSSATQSGKSTPITSSFGTPQGTPRTSNVGTPLEQTTSEHSTIDPSNVLRSSNQPSSSTTMKDNIETMTWLEFVKAICQNVFRISKENDASYDHQCNQISVDLSVYQSYHRGRQAIFPARPPSLPGTKTLKTSQVYANHFKMEVPSSYEIPQPDLPGTSANSPPQSPPEFHVYSVTWLINSQGVHFLKDRKREWWIEIVHRHGNNPNGMNKIRPVYDGGSVMVSNAPFAWRAEELKKGVKLGIEGTGIQIVIKFDTILDWEDCRIFLSNTDGRNVFPKDAIRVLNLVMKEYCVKKGYIESGRYYFDRDNKRSLDQHHCLISRSGYFQSVRALQGGLTLNVDIMSTAFYEPDMLLGEAWEKVRLYYLPEATRRSFDAWTRERQWNEEQVAIANEYWKNLQIMSTHREIVDRDKPVNEFSICEFKAIPADQILVRDFSDGTSRTLCNLLYDKYRLTRDLEGIMPAIKVSESKEHYLAWGCCRTSFGSRYAGKIENPSLLKILERSPSKRCADLQQWIRNRYSSNTDLTTAEKVFNITVRPEMMAITALQLSRPVIQAKNTHQLTWYSSARNSSFNFNKHHQFVVAGKVYPWGVLSFDKDNISWQREFLKVLRVRAKDRGIDWDREPIAWLEIDYAPRGTSNERRQKNVKEHVKNLLEGRTLKLIICFMSHKMTPEYATLKAECDHLHGVPVQVVLSGGRDNSGKGSSRNNIMNSLVYNLLLKINVKCGGVNFQLSQGMLDEISFMWDDEKETRKKTILLGADVTHPRGMNSIAAVVATTDSSFGKYSCRMETQRSGVEIIQNLKDMVKDLLRVYSKNEQNQWPEHILFFRDGVSETAYLDVLRREGVWILQAAEEIAPKNEKPKLTIILAVKRHHTRFFTLDTTTQQWVNMSEGTVVDTGVTHPQDYDFFLCSQGAAKGTSRATHYYVLLDQIGVGRDDLYKLVYYLCHTYQRCTKSVSLVTPVYYSHLAAFRAKLYMEHYSLEHKVQPRIYDVNAHLNLRDRLWFL